MIPETSQLTYKLVLSQSRRRHFCYYLAVFSLWGVARAHMNEGPRRCSELLHAEARLFQHEQSEAGLER